MASIQSISRIPRSTPWDLEVVTRGIRIHDLQAINNASLRCQNSFCKTCTWHCVPVCSMYLDSHCSYPVSAAAKKEFAKVENDLFSPPAALPKHVNRRQAGGAELQVLFFHCKLITKSNLSLKICQNAKILLKNSAKTYFRALFVTLVAFCHETDLLISADQCHKLFSNSFLCVVFE